MTIKRRGMLDAASHFLANWSLPRQMAGANSDSDAARSSLADRTRPRLEEADRIGTSICPYCAVGCAQLIYARNGRPIHVEGDPRSPINQGTLCPKGAATFSLISNPQRLAKVLWRRPYGSAWEERPLEWAMDRIARLVKRTRDETIVHKLPNGTTVNHTLGIGSLGGATLDNEENYLIKKVLGAGLGIVAIENQARV